MRQFHLAVLESDAVMLVDMLVSRGAGVAHSSRRGYLVDAEYRPRFENNEAQYVRLTYGVALGTRVVTLPAEVKLVFAGVRTYPGGARMLYHTAFTAGGFHTFPDMLKPEWTFLMAWFRKNFHGEPCSHRWTQWLGPAATIWHDNNPQHYIMHVGDQPREKVDHSYIPSDLVARDELGALLKNGLPWEVS